MTISRGIGLGLSLLLICCFSPGLACAQPKNVIFLIGDGMGPEQVKAGRFYTGAPLSFESAPYQGRVTTFSADDDVTDSAASATAYATGFKVDNKVVSLAIPGDGSELETLLERAQRMGKSAGLVTSVYLTHATPAAFGAHDDHRNHYEAIGLDYLTQTRPKVLFGGAHHMRKLDAEEHGYTVVRTRDELAAVDFSTVTHINGQFGEGENDPPYEADGDYSKLPHLSEMTAAALDILDDDPDGFFLMSEGGKIDWAGHRNNITNLVHEVVEFSKTVQVVLDWAEGRTDTLIIVTADHETGGLTVTDRGPGEIPGAEWTTGGHTSTDVQVFAWGPNAFMAEGQIDNIDIHGIATAAPRIADLNSIRVTSSPR